MTSNLSADELRAKIAELEDAGRFREAAPLKTQLARPAVPPNPARDARREELKAQIAGLEAKGRFAAAAPLKTELSHLSSSH